MMSGIYIGAMGIMSNMNRMDVVANNIANAKTNGYKADNVSFRVFQETNTVAREFKEKNNIGDYENMVYMDDIKTNFDAGLYQTSNNQLDMAIVEKPDTLSKTFFVVGKNDEQFLTKNGQFTLDEDRRLSTYSGELVLGTNGNPIVIPEGAKYSIEKNGEIRSSDTGEVYGKVQMVSVDNDDLVFLQKEKASLFSVMNLQDIENRFAPIDQLVNEYNQNITYKKLFPTNETLLNIQQTGQVNIIKPANAELESYMAEGSNVDLADELVSVMETQRGVQSSQKVWQTLSDILDLESNKIGG
jgi:flagellar basal-body rod protein FlgG